MAKKFDPPKPGVDIYQHKALKNHLDVLHHPHLTLKTGKKVVTVQKYIAPIFQKSVFFFFENLQVSNVCLLLLILSLLLLLLLLLLAYVRIKGKYRAAKCVLTENQRNIGSP